MILLFFIVLIQNMFFFIKSIFRNIVYEYYKEFFSTELCKDVEGFCDWFRIKVKENNQVQQLILQIKK